MAIAAYQDVFGRMVASAAYRDRIADRPDEALARFDLTDRERRRLLAIARQPGMRVSTAIHRANRLTPLHQTLPFTCFLLGEALGPLLDRYWLEHESDNLQLPAECDRFGRFLADRLRAGDVSDPYLADVLAFERACTELRFRVDGSGSRVTDDRPDRLPPGIRIVRFDHDPVRLLEMVSQLQPPPYDVAEGAFHLVIDCRTGDPEFSLLDGDGLEALRARGLV